MKPTKKTKRTKGRAMFRDPTAEAYGKLSSFRPQKDYWHTDPVAVIPCATAKEAKAVVKMHATIDARLKDFSEMLSSRCKHWAGLNIYPDAAFIEGAIRDSLNLPTP